jgi:hypothetical protein
MLAETRFAPHFDFIGDFGLFQGCGGSLPFSSSPPAGGGEAGLAESGGGGCCSSLRQAAAGGKPCSRDAPKQAGAQAPAAPWAR